MTTLIQKSKNKTLTFEIDDAGLLKKFKDKTGESEFHVPFEQISGNKAFIMQENKTALSIGILILALAIVLFVAYFYDTDIPLTSSLFWFVVATAILVYYFKTRTRKLLLFISGNKHIDFFSTLPTRKEVEDFIDVLINQRRVMMDAKYGQPNKLLDYSQQVSNFNWLLNSRIITKAEYDSKMNVLNELFNINQNPARIGFNSN